MAQPFLGEIEAFGFNFAPKGWAFCAGQVLPINQNQALFSLLGTTYGGNGTTTFALPDLRGRIANAFGQGPGLDNYSLGQTGGEESAYLGPERDGGRRPHPFDQRNGQRPDGRRERAEQCGRLGKRLRQRDGFAGGEHLQFRPADDRNGVACADWRAAA